MCIPVYFSPFGFIYFFSNFFAGKALCRSRPYPRNRKTSTCASQPAQLLHHSANLPTRATVLFFRRLLNLIQTNQHRLWRLPPSHRQLRLALRGRTSAVTVFPFLLHRRRRRSRRRNRFRSREETLAGTRASIWTTVLPRVSELSLWRCSCLPGHSTGFRPSVIRTFRTMAILSVVETRLHSV